jgi:hypothetical protein
MKTYAVKNRVQQREVTATCSNSQRRSTASPGIIDKRSSAIVQQKMAETIDNSSRQVAQRHQFRYLFANSAQLRPMGKDELQMKAESKILQRAELDNDEMLQGKFPTAQRQSDLEEEEIYQGKLQTAQLKVSEEEELLQGKYDSRSSPIQYETDGREPDSRTGMLDQLKAGMKQLSGVDLSDVRVHRNSAKPIQLNALAYAQGNEIHLGPGQE